MIAEYLGYDGRYPAEGQLIALLGARGYQVSIIAPEGAPKRLDGSREALDAALATSPLDLLFTLPEK